MDEVREFTYESLPGKVIFGAGSSRLRLDAEIDREGFERILVIAGEAEKDLAASGTLIGAKVAGYFREVRPHVPVEVAVRARQAATNCKADALLAIGGLNRRHREGDRP